MTATGATGIKGQETLLVAKREGPLRVAEETYLKVENQVVRCTANTASDDYTIYLPPVDQAQGRIYAIHCTIANSKTVTILDSPTARSSDDWDGSTGYACDADNDGILLYSDGLTWWVLENRIAT